MFCLPWLALQGEGEEDTHERGKAEHDPVNVKREKQAARALGIALLCLGISLKKSVFFHEPLESRSLLFAAHDGFSKLFLICPKMSISSCMVKQAQRMGKS